MTGNGFYKETGKHPDANQTKLIVAFAVRLK